MRIVSTIFILSLIYGFTKMNPDEEYLCKSFLIQFKENSSQFYYFSTDSTETPEYAAKKLAQITNKSNYKLKIRVHCDQREQNKQKLSDLRLKKFEQLLIKSGLSKDRIVLVSVLDKEPIYLESQLSKFVKENGKKYADEKRAANRRIDFKLI